MFQFAPSLHSKFGRSRLAVHICYFLRCWKSVRPGPLSKEERAGLKAAIVDSSGAKEGEREREREGRKEGGRANERERPLFASSTFCLPPSFPSSLSPSLLPSAIGTPTARRSTAVRPTADSTNPLKNATKRPQFLKSSGALSLSLSLYTFSPYSRSCPSPSLSHSLPPFVPFSLYPSSRFYELRIPI